MPSNKNFLCSYGYRRNANLFVADKKNEAGSVVWKDWFFGNSSTGGQVKYWGGSSWLAKPAKYWNGTSWVIKPVKVFNGSAWVTTSY